MSCAIVQYRGNCVSFSGMYLCIVCMHHSHALLLPSECGVMCCMHCSVSAPHPSVPVCLHLQKQKKSSQSRRTSQANSRASTRESQLSDLTQALEEAAVTSTGTVFYICKQSTLGSGESPGVFLTQTDGECCWPKVLAACICC